MDPDSYNRSSAATAYLSPRTNWLTLTGQQVSLRAPLYLISFFFIPFINIFLLHRTSSYYQVTKITFADSKQLPRVATSVTFGTANGKEYTAHVGKELILAAGAINVCASEKKNPYK